VAPTWKITDIYAGMSQFMVLQIIAVALLLIFPQLATWLPSVN
jgi:TRAP-type mannitol/chloroaromatic compound transport system permease large subunit